jgi:short-subunit dehydrogenase involved in D-alanine esterification of teichoic acids
LYYYVQFDGMDVHQRLEWMKKNTRETHEAAKQGVQTNYYGTKHVTEALLPLLLSSSDGRIVNVSSSFGLLRVGKRHCKSRPPKNSHAYMYIHDESLCVWVVAAFWRR